MEKAHQKPARAAGASGALGGTKGASPNTAPHPPKSGSRPIRAVERASPERGCSAGLKASLGRGAAPRYVADRRQIILLWPHVPQELCAPGRWVLSPHLADSNSKQE